MNRNLIVTIVVVAIIALAGGYYVMSHMQAAPQAPSQTAAETPTPQPSAAMEKASLKSFMTMVGDQQCQFNDTETGNSGTVYLNSGKMRGDFSSTVNGKPAATHMINDGTDAYIWMDDQATGFKTNLKTIEEMSGQTGVQQSVDLNKQVDYKCTGWTPDPVKFAVPTEVKFQDMSKMLQDGLKMMPSGSPSAASNAQACAACDNLEGDQQAQCKRALKCN